MNIKMFTNEGFGAKVRLQRKRLGLKQIDLANALQVSPQAVSKWERRENAPDVSILVPLSKLLGISTDKLLGAHEDYNKEIETTVFVSDIPGSTRKTQSMAHEEVETWTNGFLFQLTEISLRHDGISVKYIGDGLLCFFSGADRQQRAIQASISAKKIVAEPLHIGWNSGVIYPCAIGHPDYARPDILNVS